MINLRYHIVSLTAVFLAIGIGLTLGSTFLDRATVDNLNGQLETLKTRLDDREQRIGELDERLDTEQARNEMLDTEGSILLAARLEAVPTLIIGSRGVDEADAQAAVQALVAAGADVQGQWWFTERWALDDDGEVSDLALALGEESTDPSRLRREAVNVLGGELRTRQLRVAETPVPATPVPDEDGTTDPSTVTSTVPEPATERIAVLDALVEAGFVEFEAVQGGPEDVVFAVGTRIVFLGGSSDVPDDLTLEPLIERMARATDTPVLGVLTSAAPDAGTVSDAVLVVRDDDDLRNVVATVDDVENFAGLAAMVLALGDIGDGIVGHYGLDETASRLLPPARTP